MRGRFAAVLGAILLLVLAPMGRAGEQSETVDGLRVTISTNWPSTLNRGWQPATVRVANPTGEDRTVGLSFQCYSGPGTDIVTRNLRVRAGATEQFEIVLPARAGLSNAYSLTIDAGGRGFLSGVGAEKACPGHERVVLVASRSGPTTVAVAGWATDLSAESAPRAPEDASPLRVAHIGGVPISLPAPAAAPAPDHVRVEGIAFENLSALPEAYTSLHALVLDVGDGTPPPRGVVDAISAWVRSGGVLAVYGRGARAFLDKEPALAAWTEPRFRVGGSDSVATWAAGLGLLLVAEKDAILSTPAEVAELNTAIETLAPLDRPAPHSTYDLPIPGIEVPFRALTLLLVLFAILVGPVNLILVRRSGRPVLLLLTIPAIAFVFSIGLVVYGAVAQGLDVRATSSSVGVLDQRAHQGSSHERRQVFAGLAAGPGLRPGPGSVVARPADDALDWSTRREYRASYDSGLTLSGSWLPVRTPTRFSVGVDRAARARIDVERTADGWKLTNGLETEVKRLVLRDEAGELHLFQGPISAGRVAFAESASPDPDELKRLAGHGVLAAPLEDGGVLPRAAWIATVGASPLIDPCGLDYEESAGEHLVLGVLAMPEGR
ncbi:MAG: hypothetical protein NTY35_14485 [Planctomycetota bacterium]|nr:hypothetical protein [Planctomycetota bacterium]